ncbi:MAG: hypothetical protein AB8F95_17695 [Bacteroidia bacterium]
MFQRFSIALIGLMMSIPLFGQDTGLRLRYVRQNNFTYTANLNLIQKLEVGRYSTTLNLNHNHVLNTNRQDGQFVQLWLDGEWQQHFQLNKKGSIAAMTWVEGKQFFSNGAYRYGAYTGLEIKPNDNVRIAPLVGWGWDYRSGQLDNGFSPALFVNARHQFEDGLATDNRLFVRYKFLNPRQQLNVSLQSDWFYSLDNTAQLRFGLAGGMNEIDDYRAGAVERIRSDTINPLFDFQYQLFPWLLWESSNQLQWSRRRLQYAPGFVEELPFNNQGFVQLDIVSRQRFSFSGKKLSGLMSYEYAFIDRQYSLENTLGVPAFSFDKLLVRERLKDYRRRFHSWDAQLHWQMTRKNRLTLQASNRYLQYDTPSEENYDDHDELTHGLTLGLERTWNKRLFTRYSVVGNLRQYAFLFRQRSQENYGQYALRFAFDYRWTPFPRLSLSGSQYVYVTYNVKTFSDRNRTDRSTRNLETRQQFRWRANRKWSLRGSFYQKGTHLSYLDWNRFAETPLDTNTIATTELMLERNLSLGKGLAIQAGVGYKHFSQIRRLNSSMTSLENKIEGINLAIRTFQTGPVTQLRIRNRRGGTFSLSFWWQYQHSDFTFDRLDQLVSAGANYREIDLVRITTGFRPFFNLEMAF